MSFQAVLAPETPEATPPPPGRIRLCPAELTVFDFVPAAGDAREGGAG